MEHCHEICVDTLEQFFWHLIILLKATRIKWLNKMSKKCILKSPWIFCKKPYSSLAHETMKHHEYISENIS